MKASKMIERLEQMIENKGDVDVLILRNGSGLYEVVRVDSANTVDGEPIIFVQG